jgi:outer membrane protein insertion porin family/translocation and assembly module TamA
LGAPVLRGSARRGTLACAIALRLARAAIVAAGCAGCAHKPPVTPTPCGPPDASGCLVDGVDVIGTIVVSADEVKGSMVTSAGGGSGSGLSGLWDRLTSDRQRLNPVVLERDLERVERFLRARGFYDAHVRAGRVRIAGDKARIEIVVDEGPPVVVDRREITWKEAAEPPPAAKAAALGAADADGGIKVGARVDEQANAQTKEAIERALADAGYAYAAVTAEVQVDRTAHRAHVTYTVALGPACTFGPVTVTLDGRGNFLSGQIREVAGIAEGEPYAQKRIDQAKKAIRRLGVFDTVEARPELSPAGEPPQTHVPLVLLVAPAPRRPKGSLDVAFEAGSQVEAHVKGGLKLRNLFGRLGQLSLDAKLGLVLYPLSLSTTGNEAPIHPLPQARLGADLTQPISLPSQTNALAGAAVAMYQLFPSDLLGYFEVSGKAGVERSFWASAVHLALLGKVQYDLPFLYPSVTPLPATSGYGPVTVPLVELDGSLDKRRYEETDPASPHQGVYLRADVQLAGLDTEDVRVRSEVRGYVPIAHRWTLAMRLGGGVLYAFGGPLAVPPNSLPITCNAVTGGDGRFCQLLQLRGFQSGGPESNRGYPYGGIGPHEAVPIPTAASSTIEPFSQIQGGRLSPTGGSAIWEASVDLRFPIVGDLGGAVFVDGSDVWRVDLAHPYVLAPHLSTGIEARYETPIVTLRADLGVRIPGAQVIGVNCPVYDPTKAAGGADHLCQPGRITKPGANYLDPQYGLAGSIAGLPLAVSLSLGEAF